MAYPNETLGSIIGARVGSAPQEDLMRAFPDLAQRVAIAQQAAEISATELSELHNRLGLQRDHGGMCEDAVQVEPSGEVEALARQIDRLTDTVRDIRGFAETLNAKL